MTAFARSRALSALLWTVLASSLLLVLPAAAVEEHGRGYVEPPDYERLYQEKMKIYPEKRDLPSNFSWVDLDGVTPVKNQSSCGSCWAFAAIAQIESHILIEYGIEMDLSEQQMIECNPYGADCGGGWASAVYNVAMTYGAIRNAAEPYENSNGGACTQGESLPFGFVTDWNYVSDNVTQIKNALLEGPVCSSMDAEYPFDEYAAGTCYDDPGGAWTNHLILIVGWDDRACNNNGAWICKNSWGTDFGDYGYFTIQYDAGLIGTGVTQINYIPPPTTVQVTGPLAAETMIAGDPVDITWNTSGAACSTVDIWMNREGGEYDILVASGVPNTGSYTWTVINESTAGARFCVVANGDTRDGFGFSPEPVQLLGHRTRYVSSAGSNTPPYDQPWLAAHTIIDAVQACTGMDTVMVAAGDYLETVLVESPVRLYGGWDATFTTRDPAGTPTRLRGLNSALRFMGDAGDASGVDGFTFYDCQGAIFDTPQAGRHGGAIITSGTSPTIANNVFENCMATQGGSFGTGGAIQVLGGSPVISGNTFTGGLSVWGGAVALFDAVDAAFADNVFTSNACLDSTDGRFGGAVYVSGGSVSFDGDVFDSNGTVFRGGGVFAQNASVTVDGAEFRNNSCEERGAGLSIQGGVLTVRSSTFEDNASRIGFGGGIGAETSDVDVRNTGFSANSAGGIGGGLTATQAGTVTMENSVLYGNTGGSNMGAMFVITSGPFDFRNNVVMGNTGGIGGNVASSTLDYNVWWQNGGTDLTGLVSGPGDVTGDPMFRNAPGGDFGLTLDSVCLDAGDPDASCTDPDGSPNDIGCLGGPLAVPVAPSRVLNARLEDVGGTDMIVWDANGEPDVHKYVVLFDGEAALPSVAWNHHAEVLHPATSIPADAGAGVYHVVAVDADGYVGGFSDPVTTTTSTGIIPRRLAVTSVSPNPFNPSTEIRFETPRTGRATVKVHDLRGRTVSVLVDEVLEAGAHTVRWDGRSSDGATAASGVYFLRLVQEGESRTSKMLLSK